MKYHYRVTDTKLIFDHIIPSIKTWLDCFHIDSTAIQDVEAFWITDTEAYLIFHTMLHDASFFTLKVNAGQVLDWWPYKHILEIELRGTRPSRQEFDLG